MITQEAFAMLDLRILSPIFKVLPTCEPEAVEPRFSGLLNEVVSFQLAFRPKDRTSCDRTYLRLEIESAAKEYLHVRRVKYIPSRTPALSNADSYYLNNAQPGLYPDILEEIRPHGIRALPWCWESLWFDFKPDGKLAAGDYPVTLRLYNEDNGDLWGEASLSLHVVGAALPEQTLIHTKWLHTDCLADWYDVPVFSEEYWRIVENYVSCMVEHGINTVLTPTHTPPLDTRIGSYRRTVQLVDVTVKDGKYSFGFGKFYRWVEMCQRCGVQYFEIAHLFTQWGARCAPQWVADKGNGVERIFGWDVPATGEEYSAFLKAFLPALQVELKKLGIADHTIFHISDEPHADQLDGYLAAKNLVKSILPNAWLIDALSDVAFYDSGAVEHPVPGNNHIEPFLERNIPDLWTYYCIGQGVDVSNVFVAMPGARTRVFGAQLYKFDIKGILQWGFNYYYAQGSDYLINPWLDTDMDGFAQSGDGYQVYPGRDGKPVASLRLMHVHEAMQDLRAMQLLEKLAGRETVLKLIDEGVEPIRFATYPHEDSYILSLREKVNAEIEKRL